MSDDSPKYLAIKNWEKYQVIQHGKPAPWCRLYAKILRDDQVINWTAFKRGVWLSLLALRAGSDRNLTGCQSSLRRMLEPLPEEAKNYARAVQDLVQTRFLIPTNQEFGYEKSGVTPDQSRVEKRQSRVEKKQPRRKKAPAVPFNGLFELCKGFAWADFMARRKTIPSWNGKDFSQLALLTKRKSDLSIEEFKKRWSHYATSTDPFTVKQGLSLSYFSANFDKFFLPALSEAQLRSVRNVQAAEEFARSHREVDTDIRGSVSPGSEKDTF